jgi:acetolactate synthase I/II/III large subunit
MSEAEGRTVGEALIDLLRARGVDTVFGIPGVHTVELYRGLAASTIRHISARHEAALGFMADGYARATGRPGVCFVITGPGVTNIATPMAQAYGDSIPMLVISSVNPAGRDGSGDGWLHELPDQQGVAQRVAAFSHTVRTAAELPQVLDRAFAVFDGARPRPVHIALPTTLLSAPAGDLVRNRAPSSVARPLPDAATLDAARNELAYARRPLLLVGGGAQRAGREILALAERLDAPVVLTINARGLLPHDHPLNVPLSASLSGVRALIGEADVVLAVGTELGPTDYDMWDEGGFGIPGRLIRVDIDPEQAMRGVSPDITLIGDAGGTLARLLDGLGQVSADGAARATAARHAAFVDIEAIDRFDLDCLETVRAVLPDAIVVGDSTRQVYAGNLYFGGSAPRGWFNAATGYGALGYGLPAAVGAAIGAPERPVVCLCGDGGLQFSLGELGTAKESGVRVILLLLNNGGYGEIKAAMRRSGVAPVGVDLFTPDFQQLVRAYGWSATRLGAGDSLAAALRSAAGREGPSLIEFGLDGCVTGAA